MNNMSINSGVALVVLISLFGHQPVAGQSSKSKTSPASCEFSSIAIGLADWALEPFKQVVVQRRNLVVPGG